MSDFLPTTYEVPVKPSNYMKFQDGDNRFRILSSPILGYEWWVDQDGNPKAKGDKIVKGDKPVRVPMAGPVPESAIETARHFWAMKVWNYQEKMVQILELTQASIQKPLKALARDEDWGSPVDKYDIVVNKTGEKLDTEYQLTPKPAKKMDEAIKELCDNTPVNLNALYDGEDPFMTEHVDPSEVKI